MSKKTIFLIILALIAAFWAWYFFVYKITKVKAVKILVKDNSRLKEATLNNYGEDYLVAWATAVRSKKSTFDLNGKSYSTEGGKAL